MIHKSTEKKKQINWILTFLKMNLLLISSFPMIITYHWANGIDKMESLKNKKQKIMMTRYWADYRTYCAFHSLSLSVLLN